MFRGLRALPFAHVQRSLAASFGARQSCARRCAVDGGPLPAAMALPAVPVVGAATAPGMAAGPCRLQPLRWHALKAPPDLLRPLSIKQWARRSTLAALPPPLDIRGLSPLALLRAGFAVPVLAPCRATTDEQREARLADGSACCPPVGDGAPEADEGGETQQHGRPQAGGTAVGAEDFVVINFYKLTDVADPNACVQEHLDFIRDWGLDIKGRIYISAQGINAQLSGPREEAMEYARWVKEDARFADIVLQVSPSSEGHAFPRLRLRYKESLVQVVGGTARLPVTSADQRAVPLSPAQWRTFLERAQAPASASDSGGAEPGAGAGAVARGAASQRPLVILDVRNGYEWDVGHFSGAVRPPVEDFRSTDFGLAPGPPEGPGVPVGRHREGEEGMEKAGGSAQEGIPQDSAAGAMSHKSPALRMEEGQSEEAHLEKTELRPGDASGSTGCADSGEGAPVSESGGSGSGQSRGPRKCPSSGPRAIIPQGVEASEVGEEDPLLGVDKENTDILMYCTGGIRCDVYSTLLRQQGYKNLYSLEGGVARYLKEEGPSFWKGHLFVFDSRLAVPPQIYAADADGSGRAGTSQEGPGVEPIVRCTLCSGDLEQVRHRNCANAACNALILMCTSCARSLKGACSAACAEAPGLRPFLENAEPYKRSHLYVASPVSMRPAGYVSKRALKKRQRRLALGESVRRSQAVTNGVH